MVKLWRRSDIWRRSLTIKIRLLLSDPNNQDPDRTEQVLRLLNSTFPNTCWYNVGLTYEKLVWCQIVYDWCQKYQVLRFEPLEWPVQTASSIIVNKCPAIECQSSMLASTLCTALSAAVLAVFVTDVVQVESTLYFPQISYSSLLTNTIGVFPSKHQQPIVVSGLPARIKSAQAKLIKELGGSLDLFELMVVDL